MKPFGHGQRQHLAGDRPHRDARRRRNARQLAGPRAGRVDDRAGRQEAVLGANAAHAPRVGFERDARRCVRTARPRRCTRRPARGRGAGCRRALRSRRRPRRARRRRASVRAPASRRDRAPPHRRRCGETPRTARPGRAPTLRRRRRAACLRAAVARRRRCVRAARRRTPDTRAASRAQREQRRIDDLFRVRREHPGAGPRRRARRLATIVHRHVGAALRQLVRDAAARSARRRRRRRLGHALTCPCRRGLRRLAAGPR